MAKRSGHGHLKADKGLKPGTQGSSWVTFAQATDSFFSFLAVLLSLWDINSPTRDRTRAHGCESAEF